MFRIFFLSFVLFFNFNDALSAEPLEIVMLGDSLTAGYGLENPNEENLATVLENELNKKQYQLTRQINITNAGISGDTTAGGLARLDWSLASNTDILIVALGGNDVLRGLSALDAKKNLAEIISKSQARGIQVILLGMKSPPNLGRKMSDDFIKLFLDLSQEFKVPLYPFLLEGVAADPAFNQLDGIHPNPKGVIKITEQLAPFIAEVLQKLRL